MTAQNIQLLTWDGTKQKRVNSETAEIKLGKVAIGELPDVEQAISQGDANTLEAAKAYADSVGESLGGDVSADISDLQSGLAQEILDRVSGDSSTLASAKTYADQKITDLIGAAPSALDTLKEIADAINNDASIAATLTTAISTEATTRAAADTALDTRVTALEAFKDAQVVYVTKSGSDVSGTGGQHKPYASVSSALASISDASASKRYLIKLGAGSYTEASALALKANVFIVGEQKESVRITAPSFTMGSDFSGSADNRSGYAQVSLIGPADFNWQTVTSAAGKLYFNEVVFSSTVNMYGHNNAIAQAQFNSCVVFGNFTVSGINVGVHTNNVHFGNIAMNQHPNGGMATILAAAGGFCTGTVTLTTTVNDFNRRCSLFAKNFYMEYVTVNGSSAYADMNEGSLPRSRDRISAPNGGNVVYITAKAPHVSNSVSIGEPGYQYLYSFSYVHASSDTDLYVISMGSAYSAANVGRSIFIESDSYGLTSNTNGGDINLTTAETSGSGVRGKVKISARLLDMDAKKIVSIADGTDAQDAVSKSQLDSLGSVVGDIKKVSKTAFEAISARQICYVKTDGTVALAIASADLDTTQLLMASENIASGAAGKFFVVEGTVVGGFSSLSIGKKYYISPSSPGAIIDSVVGFSTGDHVCSVGRAISASELVFAPMYEFEF